MASDAKSFASSALAAVLDLTETNWVEWYRRIVDTLINKYYLYRKIIDSNMVQPVKGNDETDKDFTTRFDKWEELQVQGWSTVNSKLGPLALLFACDKGIVANPQGI